MFPIENPQQAPDDWKGAHSRASSARSYECLTPERSNHGSSNRTFRYDGSRSPPSCPRLSRLSWASTPFLRRFSKQDVGGRDKPGHDSGEMVRYDSNLGNAIADVAPPPHDLRRGAKPMRLGMTPARSRKFPCSGGRIPC